MKLKECTKCPLHETRTQVVVSRGGHRSGIFLVGEAPGKEEDLTGMPFVGRAGKTLSTYLQKYLTDTIEEVDFYITNAVKCLRGSTQVYLADGSSERINYLVKHCYSGNVATYMNDQLGNSKVTGWHRSSRQGRRLLKISFAAQKENPRGIVGAVLTEDHPVLVVGGWKSAGQLTYADLIATGLPDFNRRQKKFIIASLLGDASCSRDTQISFTHGPKQRDYLEYKRELMASLYPTPIKKRGFGYRFDLPSMRAITNLNNFDVEHKVWLLDDFGLAVWFMDDGHLRERAGRSPDAEISIKRFDMETRNKIVNQLNKKGVPCRVRGHRIVFNVDQTIEFSKRISSFVIPSMRYKLISAHRDLPFDEDSWETELPSVLYSLAIIDTIKPIQSDETLYCLDVAHTHNFITPGGIVHNCRPPDNRTPTDEELNACAEWLDRQIDKFKPWMIVALGSPAAKRLTGDATLGDRVGTVEWSDKYDCAIFITYHPAYIARGNQNGMEAWHRDFEWLNATINTPQWWWQHVLKEIKTGRKMSIGVE